MMRLYLNWKSALVLMALLIVSASLYYTHRLANELAAEEKKKVAQVVEAIRIISSGSDEGGSFELQVLESNTTIPFIIASEGDTIRDYRNDFKNIDLGRVSDTLAFLNKKLRDFKALNPPIVSDFGTGVNYIYYGESYLLTQLRYFPYVQLTIIVLFLVVVLIAISAANRSMQNQVWVGLSKETAHQLGTPLSALAGWIELLRDRPENEEAVQEMEKDLARLQLVADRFSKIGSTPELSETDLLPRLEAMVDYMQKRAPSKVKITLETDSAEIPVLTSGPLFDWVLENLIRNALDAMPGQGSIHIAARNAPRQVVIDLTDTGKGMPRRLVRKIFSPGFTTKKRGWGLGLSLARRIVERYHHGSLFVKQTEAGKGTTFRIVLRR